MIKIKLDSSADEKWNDRASSSKFGTYVQTFEYSKYVKKVHNHEPVFLKFLDEKENIVGQVLIIKKKRLFGISNFYDWRFSPLVFKEELADEIMQSFSKFLKNKKFRGFTHPLSKYTFADNNFNVEKMGTYLIDLSLPLETIFEKTDKRSVRNNIKRAEKHNVKIKEIITKEDVKEYHHLLSEHRKSMNYKPTPLEHTLALFDDETNNGNGGFLAEWEGDYVGGLSFSSFNGYLKERGVARSKVDYENKLYSLDLIRWNLIKWGKENGCKFYDLSGVKPENRTSKEEGIFRNKRKWNGDFVEFKIFRN